MVKEKQTGSVLSTPPPPKVVSKNKALRRKLGFSCLLEAKKAFTEKTKIFFK